MRFAMMVGDAQLVVFAGITWIAIGTDPVTPLLSVTVTEPEKLPLGDVGVPVIRPAVLTASPCGRVAVGEKT